jgi:O-antigen/teichoic acid export membrane protein
MIPKSILFWSVIFAAVSSFMKAAQAALVMALAAILTPLTYSNFGILYSLQSAMGTLSVTGLVEYSIGRLPEFPSDQERASLFRLVSGVFIVISLLSFVVIGASSFSIIREKNILLGGILAIILGGVLAFGTLQASLQRLEGQQKASLYSGAAMVLASIVGIFIGAWFHGEIVSLFGFALIGSIITMVILIFRKHFYMGTIPSIQILLKVFRSITPYIVIGVIGWLTGYGMNFFIDEKLGPIHVAYFTFLFNLASIGQLLAASMNMSWSPHFFRIFQSEGKKAEDQTRRFYSFQSIGMGIAGFLCVVILPYAANAIGGNLVHYANFKLELALLFVGYIFCIPFWHSQNYYFATSKGDALMYLSLWSGVAGFSSWIVCMDLLGSLGVYVGFPLQAAIKSIAGWFAARKLWGIRPPIVIILLSALLILSGAYIPTKP